jgi:hypothetical protein
MLEMKKTMLFLVLPLLAVSLVAQEIPIGNWPAPATFRPEGTIGAMADLSPGVPFVAVTPCRVYDSRSATILSGGGTRNVNMDGGTCGLPANAVAYSIHITAFGSTPSASYGFITVYPAGAVRPTVSTMNFLGGSQTSSAAIVPAGSGYDIWVYSTMTTHFVVDVNGYYIWKFPATNQFVAESTSAGAAILGINGTALAGAHAIGGYAGGAAMVYGIQGQIGSSAAINSAGIHGLAANVSGSSGVRGLVQGVANLLPPQQIGFSPATGVTGIGRIGVMGINDRAGGGGVVGIVPTADGSAPAAYGRLGYELSGIDYALYTVGPGRIGGNLSVTGTLSVSSHVNP